MPAKPPAIRLLDQRRIPHTLHPFDPAIRDAAEVARALGRPPESVYKTLVLETDPPGRKPLLLMLPAGQEADLKALAAELGHKRLRMASHRDAERLTGLLVGGIGALALTQKAFPTYIARAALELEAILVSAGQRGMDVELAPADLLALTGAKPVL